MASFPPGPMLWDFPRGGYSSQSRERKLNQLDPALPRPRWAHCCVARPFTPLRASENTRLPEEMKPRLDIGDISFEGGLRTRLSDAGHAFPGQDLREKAQPCPPLLNALHSAPAMPLPIVSTFSLVPTCGCNASTPWAGFPISTNHSKCAHVSRMPNTCQIGKLGGGSTRF